MSLDVAAQLADASHRRQLGGVEEEGAGLRPARRRHEGLRTLDALPQETAYGNGRA